MAFNLDAANSTGKTRRDDSRLAAICKATIEHPNMSANQISAGLNLPHGAYVPVGVVRQVLKTLASMGDITHEGKLYRFVAVVPTPTLVKKEDEKKSA